MTLTPLKRKNRREKLLKDFDPDQNIKNKERIFGLPFGLEESELIILPVPWDTTHANDGAADAPDAILDVSANIPLFRDYLDEAWRQGVFMQNIPAKWKESSYELKKIRNRVKRNFYKKLSEAKKNDLLKDCRNINNTCRLLNEWVENKCNDYLAMDKTVGLLGGDQGISSGLLQALGKKYPSFAILHFDAHPDMKASHEGLDYTDFSSMYHATRIPQVEFICLFGCREITYAEHDIIAADKRKFSLFSDTYISEKLLRGVTWKMIINEALSTLPKNIYISLDMDVMMQWQSPGVAFPAAGGINYQELRSFLIEIGNCGKNIIGFDLCGIRPSKDDSWEAKIGASVLFDLASACMKTKIKQK